ncbi:MAG: nucleotidyltransferase family protein [Lachnospiraceae bacterium]|nr:nucleotidyltransferase family protein [Cuneatibacter sp.]MDD6456664.1 nucleotidyltransferase family protein [Lachnospiraceae bacterium]
MKYSLIYLAAGNSRRFGKNKLLVEWNGRPLYEYGLNTLKEAVKDRTDSEILLVSQYPNILQAHPEVVCVYSPKSTEGLSWSIRAGIECVLGREQKREQQQECRRLPDWQEGDHWLLFLTADQPLVEKETIQNLLLQADNAERLTSGKTRIIRARYAGKEGSPVLFHASLIPELQQLSGDEGGRSVIRAHREEMAFVDVADERQMTDVDTVEDLEKLEQRKEDL